MVDFAKNEYGRHSDGAASDGLWSSICVGIQAAGERSGEAPELTEWPSHPLPAALPWLDASRARRVCAIHSAEETDAPLLDSALKTPNGTNVRFSGVLTV